MRPRFDIRRDCWDSLEAILTIDRFIEYSGLDRGLLTLLDLRTSQLMGDNRATAFHTERALDMGKSHQWVASLEGWPDTTVYNPVERAVLEFTEYLTQTKGEVSDQAYDAIRHFFVPRDIARLIVAIGVARTWNELALVAGSDSRVGRTPRKPDRAMPRSL